MKSGATFRIIDLHSGKATDVEVIQPRQEHRPQFGDSLVEYCNGAIKESESRISETTHRNVRYVRNPSEGK